MHAGERLPEQDADRPHVPGRAGDPAGEPLGRDVCERPGHVPHGGEGLGVLRLGQAEVEQPDRDPVPVGEEDVRRLDVAVDDPARMRMREPLENLRRRLHGLRVAQLAGAQRVAERPPGRVLVRDVDVTRVAPAGVGAQAALVA